MKYLLLLLTSLSLQASLDELDLTLPEQPAAYISPEKQFFLNLGDYKEPPTKAQMITFWTLNALDVYTSYEGLKNPNISEVNPLLGKDPSLERLILHKVVIGSFILNHSSKRYMKSINVFLTFTIINNYEHM